MSNLPNPVTELSEEEFEIYSRQIALADIGYTGQLKLRNSRVCVVGLGGLGSPSALKLAAMGIGYLRLVDRDVVCRSDLHRQYLYDPDSLGYPKVEVAANRLRRLNPHVEFDPVPAPFNQTYAEDLVKDVDVVVDGLDRIEARYLLNRTCVKLKIPYIFGAAIELAGNVSTLIPGKTPCLECFYPGLEDRLMPRCAVVGVHPSATGLVSSLQVSEVTKLLIDGKPNLLNKLLHIDLRSMTFDELEIAPSEGCPVCSSEPNGTPKPLKERFFEETCARDGRRVFVITPKKKVHLDLEELYGLLQQQSRRIRVKGLYGMTFEYSAAVSLSILKSGVMIAQVSPEERKIGRSDILQLYRFTLVEGLGVEEGSIPEATDD